MSKTLELALQWRNARIKRLAAQKEVDALEVVEKDLKQKVLDSLRKNPSKAVSNGDRLFQLVPGTEPSPEDWGKIWKHIQKTGEFELVQRRLNNTAIKERWELGVKIPGVGSIPTETLSDTKAK